MTTVKSNPWHALDGANDAQPSARQSPSTKPDDDLSLQETYEAYMSASAQRVGKAIDGMHLLDAVYVCATVMVHAIQELPAARRGKVWLDILKFMRELLIEETKSGMGDAEQKR